MEYIWEYFCGINNVDVHIQQAEIISPYYEMPPEQENLPDEVAYNPMYRYASIFFPLLLEMEESKEMESWYLDIFSHYLVQVDLKSGLSYGECRRNDFIDKALSGEYGRDVAETFGHIVSGKQYILAHYFVTAEETEALMMLFSRALMELMGTGVLYQDKDDMDYYIYYAGREENQRDKRLIGLTVEMLLPLGKKIRILWNNHFGICNEDVTMQDGNIEII